MEEKRRPATFRSLGPSSPAAAKAAGPRLTAEPFGHKLWRGKWVAGFTAAAFALLAMMLGALQQPLYREQLSIEVQGPHAAAADETFIEAQIRIIQSQAMAERVLARLSDVDRARLLERPHFWWMRAGEPAADYVRRHILARAAVKSAEQAGIIDISFLAADPAAGAHFLNILARELADFNVERTWRVVQTNRQWTERQLDDLRRKWEQSEQVLAEYQQVSGLGGVAAGHPSIATVPEADDAKTRQLRARLAELNREIAQWQALYGPSGATVLKLKADAAETEAALRQQRRPGVLLKPVSQPVTPAQQAHLAALQQEAASNRAIYESTATRLKEASVLMAAELGSISVVDPATPANNLATPSQFMTGSLGAFMGLALGVAFVALRERFSGTFSEPAALGQYLGIPVLGAIPANRFGEDGKIYDEANQEPALHLNFEADLQTAEAFRTIRSSILLGVSHIGANQKSGPRRLVFTSASAGEGTTFVTGNLGAALASAQRRVLLVDGNLRDPGLHKIFGADNERGLADLLGRQLSENAVSSRDVIRETQIPDLYLLSAGQAGTRAPEILSSVQLPLLIREFAKGFDLVLVDSAPALPYADARSLARAADGVVLVVKAGSTGRDQAREAREAISQDGSPIIGAILTEWDSALSASA